MSIIHSTSHGRSNLPFTPEGDDGPVVPILVRLLLHLGRERNGAHDAIAELLVQDSLVGVSVILDDLEQAVDQWFLGRHVDGPTPIRETLELLLQRALLDAEDGSQLLDIFRGWFGLAIKDGGDGDFIAAYFFGDGLEGQVLLRLGFEESWIGGWKAVYERRLRWSIGIGHEVQGRQHE